MGEYNNIIHFYTPSADFGYFSNFSRHSIFLKGKRWPTSEHYFQAQKFAGTPIEEKIRCVERPGDAAGLGRSRANPLRADWEEVKEGVMKEALMAKFTQHKDLKKALLDTKGKTIVEHTEKDAYWGDAYDGTGLNRLGYLLMVVRDELLGLPTPPDPLLQKDKPVAVEEKQDDEPANTTVSTDEEILEDSGDTEEEMEPLEGIEPNNNKQYIPGPSTEAKKVPAKKRGKRGAGSKAREKRSVFRDADGSATLEKTTDVKGTVTVIGDGTVFSEKALPPQARVVVNKHQMQRKYHPTEKDFAEQEDAEDTPTLLPKARKAFISEFLFEKLGKETEEEAAEANELAIAKAASMEEKEKHDKEAKIGECIEAAKAFMELFTSLQGDADLVSSVKQTGISLRENMSRYITELAESDDSEQLANMVEQFDRLQSVC